MTNVERFLEDYDFRKMFPEDLIPERTEWEDLYDWLQTADVAALDLLDENEKLKKQMAKMNSSANNPWHDLIKNPKDLPSDGSQVLVQTKRDTECAVFWRRSDGSYYWNCSFSPIDENPDIVIAWCDIPEKPKSPSFPVGTKILFDDGEIATVFSYANGSLALRFENEDLLNRDIEYLIGRNWEVIKMLKGKVEF